MTFRLRWIPNGPPQVSVTFVVLVERFGERNGNDDAVSSADPEAIARDQQSCYPSK